MSYTFDLFFSKLAEFTAKLQLIGHALTPFNLACKVGLVVEFWSHKPEVGGGGGSTPSTGEDLFLKISSANCYLAKNWEKCLWSYDICCLKHNKYLQFMLHVLQVK